MTDLIGTQVRWRHIDKTTGKPVLDIAGVVLAVGLDGGSFKVLIGRSDGTFSQFNAIDFVVTEVADEHAALDAEIARLRGECADLGTAYEALRASYHLKSAAYNSSTTFTEDNENITALAEWFSEKNIPLDDGETRRRMVDQTIALLDEFWEKFKTATFAVPPELHEKTIAELGRVEAERDAARTELAELKKKHKPKGPKGPAE